MKSNNKNKIVIFLLLLLVVILAFTSGWHKARVDNLQKRNQILEQRNQQLEKNCFVK
jgi:uncharacterized membrane protein